MAASAKNERRLIVVTSIQIADSGRATVQRRGNMVPITAPLARYETSALASVAAAGEISGLLRCGLWRSICMNAICTRYFGWKAGSAQKTQTRGRRVGAVAPVSPGLVVKRQSYKCGGLRSRNTGVEVWREYGERAVRLVRPV